MSILIINLSNIPHITTKPFIYVCMYLFLHWSPPLTTGASSFSCYNLIASKKQYLLPKQIGSLQQLNNLQSYT